MSMNGFPLKGVIPPLVTPLAARDEIDLPALEAEASRLRELPPDARIEHRYDRGRLDDVRRRQVVAMRHVRRTGAVIESCPTSNLRIAGLSEPRHHPLRRFLEAGLPVVLGADDPGLFATTLEEEFAKARALFGIMPTQISNMRQVAWESRCDVLSGRTACLPWT